VREWDSNGTNFGYRPELGHTAGEFGHNDFYPVCIAGAQIGGHDGRTALLAMVCLDEIRGRLAEVFSLKSYKIDHVLHGAVASAAAYGALVGATAEQIESAIGMVVAHYVPFRAIRAGKQLSDSKGASAAISTEAAVLSVHRSMDGFLGPRDIFRNPEAVYRLFEGPGQLFWKRGAPETGRRPVPPSEDASPFELVLSREGDDFAVMGMHFKLGLYEHQSAGAIQAVIDLMAKTPRLHEGHSIKRITIVAYEPAFGIIGDPAKKSPKTRQSADHSMAFIISRVITKARQVTHLEANGEDSNSAWWKALMLEPRDYSMDAIFDDETRRIMDLIEFVHGGEEYDRRYPDGIPTSVEIEDVDGEVHESGMVMYPAGHARNRTADLEGILAHKFELLGGLALREPGPIIERYSRVGSMSAAEVSEINSFDLEIGGPFE
jgi:2-methylcitrate dehydratase